MKFVLAILINITPCIAFAQYFSGLDVTYGKPKVDYTIPDVVITSQTKKAAIVRLYSGYQFDHGFSVEGGAAIHTPFHQSAVYLPLPDTGYRVDLDTYNVDITLTYQLPESISSHIRLLTGLVWTKNNFKVNKYVLGNNESYSLSETKYSARYGIEYIIPVTNNVFWKTTFSTYGDDKILTVGLTRYFN